METKNLSLEHLVRPSSNKEGPFPALFLFHGYGSDENDLFSFATEIPDKLFVISAKAPHPLQPFGSCWYSINFDAGYGKWSNTEQAEESRELIVKFIDEAIEAYGLDPANINLLGFSQGTVLSYAVALSYPQKFRNVVALSGYIDQSILVDNYTEGNHGNLNIYASHGQVDPVIPPEWAEKIPGFLTELGITHVFEEFPTGHGVSLENFNSFKKWLEERV